MIVLPFYAVQKQMLLARTVKTEHQARLRVCWDAGLHLPEKLPHPTASNEEIRPWVRAEVIHPQAQLRWFTLLLVPQLITTVLHSRTETAARTATSFGSLLSAPEVARPQVAAFLHALQRRCLIEHPKVIANLDATCFTQIKSEMSLWGDYLLMQTALYRIRERTQSPSWQWQSHFAAPFLAYWYRSAKLSLWYAELFALDAIERWKPTAPPELATVIDSWFEIVDRPDPPYAIHWSTDV